MYKVNLSLTAALISVSLLAGCSSDHVKSQTTDNDGNKNIFTQNRGIYRPLGVGATQGYTTNNTTSGSVQSKFSDVPSGEWYAENIQWGSKLAIIDGYPDGTFQPNKSLTRAEVIKIIKSLADKGYIAIPTSGSTTIPGGLVNYAFTQAGDKPESKLINVIDNAKQSLDIAIYSLTHPEIVQAIKNAKNRGVSVRIITDKIQSSGKSQTEALKILGSAGIPLKINSHTGLMHLKMTITDKKIATTGSYNYSKAASTVNDEVLVVLQDEVIAKSFSDEFNTMWDDSNNFITIEKYIASGETPVRSDVEKEEVPLSVSCESPTIKGNINSSKEKIYHVPGGQYYEKTEAEEMFCTTGEAEAAGYRASLR